MHRKKCFGCEKKRGSKEVGQNVPADDQSASHTPKRSGRWGKGVADNKAKPDTTAKGDEEGEAPQTLTAVQSALREW